MKFFLPNIIWKIQNANNERLSRDGEKGIFQPYNWKKIMALTTTLLMCCLHEIPFRQHTFFEFSVTQLDSVPIVSEFNCISQLQ